MMRGKPTSRTARTKRAAQLKLLDACPPFMTRAQTATVAGVTTRTVDRWLTDPKVPLRAHRSELRPRTVLVNREQLRALLFPGPEEPTKGTGSG